MRMEILLIPRKQRERYYLQDKTTSIHIKVHETTVKPNSLCLLILTIYLHVVHHRIKEKNTNQ